MPRLVTTSSPSQHPYNAGKQNEGPRYVRVVVRGSPHSYMSPMHVLQLPASFRPAPAVCREG